MKQIGPESEPQPPSKEKLRLQAPMPNSIGGFTGLHIWGGKLFRGLEGRERG